MITRYIVASSATQQFLIFVICPIKHFMQCVLFVSSSSSVGWWACVFMLDGTQKWVCEMIVKEDVVQGGRWFG